MQLSRVHRFVWVAAAGALAAAGIGLVLVTRGGDDEKKQATAEDGSDKDPQSAVERRKKNAQMEPPRRESPVNATTALRSFDKEIIDYLHGAPPAKDVRDALPKLSAQVDAYVSTAAGNAPRIYKLEVDVDRDGRSDERWRLEADSTLVRRAMPPDAEVRFLRDTYVLDGDKWALRGGKGGTLNLPEPSADEVAQNLAARELRPVDKKALEIAQKKTAGSFDFKQPDGSTAKIVLFPAKPGKTPNKLGLDLDGDRDFEEMWTVTKIGVRRTIRSGEGDKSVGLQAERYALSGDKWKRL
jgi:hypothetical protein